MKNTPAGWRSFEKWFRKEFGEDPIKSERQIDKLRKIEEEGCEARDLLKQHREWHRTYMAASRTWHITAELPKRRRAKSRVGAEPRHR